MTAAVVVCASVAAVPDVDAHLLDEVATSLLLDIETDDRQTLRATWYVEAGSVEAYFDAAEQVGVPPERSAAAFARRLAEGFEVPGCSSRPGVPGAVEAPAGTNYRAFRVEVRCPRALARLTLRRVAYERQKTRATLYVSVRVGRRAPTRLLLPPRLAALEVALDGGTSRTLTVARSADDMPDGPGERRGGSDDHGAPARSGDGDAASDDVAAFPRPGDPIDLDALPPAGARRSGLTPPPTTLLLGWVEEGARHMAGGVDHLLFVAALALAATRSTWLLWMVLTFSLGHLSTMALAITYGWPRLAAVEFAIGATIVAAAVGAWRGGGERAGEVRDSGTSGGRLTWRRRDGVTFGAAAALAAGLVHGAAFGAELRGVLATSEGLLWPIAAFGVGLDAAQSVVALSCAGLLAAVERRLGPRRRGQLRRGLAVPIGLAGVAFAARALVAAAMA